MKFPPDVARMLAPAGRYWWRDFAITPHTNVGAALPLLQVFLDGGRAQGVGLQLIGEVAQGLNPAGFGFVYPILDGCQHVVAI